jgi:hypothetical protein
LHAQNQFPYGNFQEGALNWTRTSFNDPLGTTGFAVANVTTEAASEAVFADFKTLTPVMSATFRSSSFLLVNALQKVTFNVMWDKGTVTAPIPYASVNRVEFRIYDAQNVQVFNQQIITPTQTGTQERASFSNSFTPAAVGMFTCEVFMRHSNLAGIPFICYVDDIVFGTAGDFVYSKGCPGTNATTPLISASGLPAINTTFSVDLSQALPFKPTVLAIGLSDKTYGPVPLPLDLGGGCLLSQSANIMILLLTDTNGAASQQVPIPNDVKLQGVKVYFQFACDDAAGPVGFTTTAGMRITVQ